MAVREAPLRSTKYGLVPDGEGWFVLNARDTRWRDTSPLGKFCDFEGKRPFKALGFNISVFQPGEFMSMYHSESRQEDFLVLAGECILVVEGQERPLRAWDLVHCPPGTAHVIIGAGDGPSVVVAVGARGGRRKGIVYRVDDAALRHGAAAERETTKSAEAYAGLPGWKRSQYGEGWLPER